LELRGGLEADAGIADSVHSITAKQFKPDHFMTYCLIDASARQTLMDI